MCYRCPEPGPSNPADPHCRLLVWDIGITLPLDADLCRGAMPGKDSDIVPQRVDFLPDTAKEQFAVATRQVPASNAAGKENITPEENPLPFPKKAQTARAMTGNQQDFEINAAHFDGIRLTAMESWFNRLDFPCESKFQKKISLGHHGFGFRVVPHLAPVLLLNP